MNCYGGIINIVLSVELIRIFQNGEMINIVLHIQEVWSPKNENVHVLKLLKAEGLPTLFYTLKNCCETVSKQVRGITNIVLHLEEWCTSKSSKMCTSEKDLRDLFTTKPGGMKYVTNSVSRPKPDVA